MPVRDENLLDLLVADHRHLARMLAAANKIAANQTGPMSGPFCEIVQALVVHEVVEEEIVYPAFARLAWRVAGIESTLESRMAEQQVTETLLLQMERTDAFSVDFARALARLETAVTAHTGNEEKQVFRLLRSQLEEDELFKLGHAYQEAKANAPAHLLVLGSISRLIDEVREGARSTMAGAR